MTSTTINAGQTPTTQLLPPAYRILGKCTTLRELAGRFEAAIRTLAGDVRVFVLHRSAGSSEWMSLIDADPADYGSLRNGPDGEAFVVQQVGNEQTMQVVHRLSDDSEVYLIIRRQGTGIDSPESAVATLRLAVTIFDAAHQALLHRQHEKTLAFSLNQRLLQLNSLIETGIEIAALDGAVSPIHLALERAVAMTNASQGVVSLYRDKDVIERIAFPGEYRDEARTPGERCISAEFTFHSVRYHFVLTDKESRTGVTAFEGTDRLLLDALSRQVHASLENRYLLRQSLEKQKMEQDIAVAASIQQRILPSVLPVIDGYDAAGINIPSKSVGGDYYDCLQLQDGRYALVVADVAGKGIPAALLVSSFQAFLTAYLESDMPLVTMAARLNSVIHRASTDDKFITAFIGLLEPRTGILDYVNAGHNVVYCRRTDGSIVELSEGGIPFGMLDLNFPYASGRVTMEHGDRLLLYTDGIPEAHNPVQALYETHSPLQGFFARVIPEKAEEFIRDLIADVKRFTADAPQADDITALYLIRK
jgi:serine phosphatase RsbU (regulator of sigma subunit)